MAIPVATTRRLSCARVRSDALRCARSMSRLKLCIRMVPSCCSRVVPLFLFSSSSWTRYCLRFRRYLAMSLTLPRHFLGADTWLHPSQSKKQGPADIMVSEFNRVVLVRRLRVSFLVAAGACPKFGACLDTFLNRALVCPCGGGRTLRHNAARNAFHAQACAAMKEPGSLATPVRRPWARSRVAG